MQGVIGTSATDSGVILTPLMITAIGGSILSGQLVARLGKYKWIAIVGIAVSAVGGLVLLLLMNINATNTDVVISMLVLGLGMGFGMSLYTLIVQNALPQKIGQGTSALTFFRSIGSTIGLSAMGAVMNSAYLPAFQNALPATLKRVLSPKVLSALNNPQILLNPQAKAQLQATFAAYGAQGQVLYNEIITAVKTGLVQGIHNVFLLSLVLTVVSLVVVFFLREIPLKGGRSRTASEVEAINPTAEEPVVAAL